MKVRIKLIKDGMLPCFMHEDDACCDCYARLNESITIQPKKRMKIPLGFAIQLPKGYEAVIRPRSGLSSKGIDNCIGTIDCGYNAEVCAIVINNSDKEIVIENRERICQLAIRKTKKIKFILVDELDDSERGENGFGSTGVK